MRYFSPRLFSVITGDKMGDIMQISKLKIKNLQKGTKFYMLEIKRFTIHICR